MPPIRFGAFLMLHPPEEQFAIARRVDELGFDSLWTGDHVSFHGAIYESLTLLASYAGITTRAISTSSALKRLNASAPNQREPASVIFIVAASSSCARQSVPQARRSCIGAGRGAARHG